MPNSAVGVFAVSHGEDLDGIAKVLEADSIVSKPQAKLGWLESPQLFHIALSGSKKAGEAMQEIDCGFAVDGANIGTGLIGPGNLLTYSLWNRS
jgi:hypothetical protein